MAILSFFGIIFKDGDGEKHLMPILFDGGEEYMDTQIIFKCIVCGYYAWRIKEEKTSLFENK